VVESPPSVLPVKLRGRANGRCREAEQSQLSELPIVLRFCPHLTASTTGEYVRTYLAMLRENVSESAARVVFSVRD